MSETIKTSIPENYVFVKGQKVPCSKEIFDIYHKQSRKEKMRKYRDKKDGFSSCSLEAFPEEESDVFMASNNTEDEAILNATLDMMLAELQDKPEMRRRILELLAEDFTTREIAGILNVAQGTVTYHIKKLREDLAAFR